VGGVQDAGNIPREYEIPEGVLRAGRNVVAVRMTNSRGRGGFRADPEEMTLSGEGFQVALAGQWRYRIEREWAGGRRPDFEPGIPFPEQFLMHHNPAGSLEEETPAGRGGGRGFGGRGFGRGGPIVPPTTIALGALPGENRYDREVIPVRAGQRVTIAFDNTDDMPHNVVVLEPGTLDAFGEALNAFASDPEAEGDGYIPDRDEVLFSMEMVDPRESGTLTFTAPSEPGEYPFVCTFPGHWLTMRGVILVEG
jgi:plastocyanin